MTVATCFAASLWVLAAPAVVAVDVAELEAHPPDGVDVVRLHGQILLRLAEDGYQLVAPHVDADVRLRLMPGSDEVRLEIEGSGSPQDAIKLGPEAVFRLEALQRASLAVRDTLLDGQRQKPSRSTDLQTVGVRFAVAAKQPDAVWFLELLAIALVDADFTLASEHSGAKATLCLRLEDDRAVLSFVDANSMCGARPTATVARGAGQTDASYSNAVIAAALRLLAEHDNRPATPVPVKDREPPSNIVGGAWMPRVGLDAGSIWRSGKADPSFLADLSISRPWGLGGNVGLLVVPSRGKKISIVEMFLCIGPSWSQQVGDRVRADISVLGGLYLQTYSFGQENRGTRADWALSLPMGLSFRIWDGLWARFSAHGGLLGHDRRHLVANNVIWRRDAWLFGVAAGVAYDLSQNSGNSDAFGR